MNNKKIHTHPAMEKRLKVPQDHCIIDREIFNEISEDNKTSNEKNRLLSISITEAQTAQMWAVKGIT